MDWVVPCLAGLAALAALIAVAVFDPAVAAGISGLLAVVLGIVLAWRFFRLRSYEFSGDFLMLRG